MFKIFRIFGAFFDIINRILGWFARPFKISLGNKSVEEHPKLNRIYKKGAGYRFLLFFISLLITAICIFLEASFFYAIFSGEWILIIVLILFAICLRFPVSFCSALCGIGFFHFKTGIEKTVNKVREKINDKIESQDANLEPENNTQTEAVSEIPTQIETNENIEENTSQIDSNSTQIKPVVKVKKTRHFASLIFCMFEGLFTLAIPLGFIVIPFTYAVWAN